jgi:ATP-dependent DNA helicase RecG
LFANESTGYNVHLGRLKTPDRIIDDKMLNGTLFDVVEETMKYIIGQIKVAFEITGMPTKRTEIFEYPLPALREIVLNAIIHRDYMSPIDLQIKIFDKFITFYNPGALYGSLTIDALKKDNY